MKIVIVSTSDLQGGASRSAYRTHVALVKNGYNSTMVVLNKSSNNPTVIEGKSNRIKKIGSQVCNRLIETFFLKKYPNKSYFSTTFWGSQKIVNTINSLKPDVVHIHWIHQGALSIYDLKKIQSPIIWSMHDMWALTGGCHYDHECGNFINKCGQCVVLNSYKKNDLSYTVWKKKKSIYSNIQRLYFAGPSSWMFESAKKSSLLQKKTVIHLPTAIDVSLFKKINTSECRSLWNLPKNKLFILW